MELTALQDHQPGQIRGSGTPSSVITSHSIGFNKTGGWHEEQIVQNNLAPPTVAQARHVAWTAKIVNGGDKMSLKW